MRVTALRPLGAVVDEVDLHAIGPGTVGELKDLLAQHGVVILTGQFIDDTTFLSFLRSFGDLMFTTGETPVEGFPDLNVVSNVGRSTPPRSSFHVDTSYVARPPAYTALRAVTVPAAGGQTQFTNQYRALDLLPEDLRARVDGRAIRHVVTGLDLGPDEETEAWHPIVTLHPRSGREALYLATPARCAAVTGVSDEEAADLVGRLFAHSTREENTLRHSWSAGDVVMWDNRCVLHRADHDGVSGDRVMHRGMVAADD